MTAKSEALELHDDLSSEELDAVSGGWFCVCFRAPSSGGQTGQNDPAQMFAQIMQQMTQGG